jgi:hypothetical protein
MTITLRSELEAPLAEAAKQRGSTPEVLVVECVRKAYAPLQHKKTGLMAKRSLIFSKGLLASSRVHPSRFPRILARDVENS